MTLLGRAAFIPSGPGFLKKKVAPHTHLPTPHTVCKVGDHKRAAFMRKVGGENKKHLAGHGGKPLASLRPRIAAERLIFRQSASRGSALGWPSVAPLSGPSLGTESLGRGENIGMVV